MQVLRLYGLWRCVLLPAKGERDDRKADMREQHLQNVRILRRGCLGTGHMYTPRPRRNKQIDGQMTLEEYNGAPIDPKD